jgi:hypothetical protein
MGMGTFRLRQQDMYTGCWMAMEHVNRPALCTTSGTDVHTAAPRLHRRICNLSSMLAIFLRSQLSGRCVIMKQNKFSRPLLHFVAMIGIVFGAVVYSTTHFSKAQAHPITTNALLVSDRSTLRVCLSIDPSLASRKAEISGRFINALEQVRQHKDKDWISAGFQKEVPKLETNCDVRIPSRRMLRFETLGPGLTNNPGPFRSVILVLNESLANTVLRDRNVEYATYELMQVDDHVAVEVTSALVVRIRFLDNPEFINTYLPLVIGLDPTIGLDRSTEEPVLNEN